MSTCRPLDPGVVRQSIVSHHASASSSSSDRHISLHELVLDLVPHAPLPQWIFSAFVNKRYDCVRAVARYAELRSARRRTQCPDVATLLCLEPTSVGCNLELQRQKLDTALCSDGMAGSLKSRPTREPHQITVWTRGRCTHRAQEFSRVSSHSTHCLGFYTMHRDTDSVSTLIVKVSKLIHLQTVREIFQSPGDVSRRPTQSARIKPPSVNFTRSPGTGFLGSMSNHSPLRFTFYFFARRMEQSMHRHVTDARYKIAHQPHNPAWCSLHLMGGRHLPISPMTSTEFQQ